MKKYCLIIMAAASLMACSLPDKKENASAVQIAEGVSDSLLILPGQRIGHIKLSDNMQTLIKASGKPDGSDAAMGGATYTWFAKHDASGYRTSVYGRHNMGRADEKTLRIKKILITDPTYKTADGINTGLSLNSIRKKYTLSDSSVYTVKQKPRSFYADIKRGVAFEVDPVTNTCTAISIFAPNDTASARISMY